MIAGAFTLILGLFVIGGACLWLASRRSDPEEKRRRAVKFAAYVVIVYSLLSAMTFLRAAYLLLLSIIVASGAIELAHALHSAPDVSPKRPEIWINYAVLSCSLLMFGWFASINQSILIYSLIVIMDGFSQVAGQLFGRHKVAPRVSPAKTAEGVAGGIVATLLAGEFLGSRIGLTGIQSLTLSLAVAAAAYSGDIAASWVKRRCGIKDFGSVLPGHGGVLDRFDSLLGAAPVGLMFLSLIDLRP